MMNISDLPFPKEGKVVEYELPRYLWLEQWCIPAGVTIKLTTTTNFGFVILPVDCVDASNHRVPRRLFKF